MILPFQVAIGLKAQFNLAQWQRLGLQVIMYNHSPRKGNLSIFKYMFFINETLPLFFSPKALPLGWNNLLFQCGNLFVACYIGCCPMILLSALWGYLKNLIIELYFISCYYERSFSLTYFWNKNSFATKNKKTTLCLLISQARTINLDTNTNSN